jgi:hypothetical protein
MSLEFRGGAQVPQRMKDPADAQSGLRRLADALAEVLHPGLELPDHEGAPSLVRRRATTYSVATIQPHGSARMLLSSGRPWPACKTTPRSRD